MKTLLIAILIASPSLAFARENNGSDRTNIVQLNLALPNLSLSSGSGGQSLNSGSDRQNFVQSSGSSSSSSGQSSPDSCVQGEAPVSCF
jgi:hypothetical protein